jgi:poly-gamma-glutamate capsule biosynthesis protein CapA/YwtB (metallophosphatase superfamily)
MTPQKRSIRLIAAGDLLIHDACIQSAYSDADKSYNFKPMFQYVKNCILGSDIAICNLETTISGIDHGYKGYPEFNAPEELLDAVADCGFTIVSTANNHAVDYGENGILATIDAIHKRSLLASGTSNSAEPSSRNIVLDFEFVKVGINSYTYGTNEHPVPPDKKWLINMIDFDLIKSDIANMRTRGADIIVVGLHAGEEYLTMPDRDQVTYVKMLRDLGVDIILGNHPHIVQPSIEDPSGKFFIIYSIGNFLSNQRDQLRDTGVILDIEITETSNKWSIRRVKYHPTYVHRWEQNGKFEFRIIPLDKYQEIGRELPNFPFDKAETMLRHVYNHLKIDVI